MFSIMRSIIRTSLTALVVLSLSKATLAATATDSRESARIQRQSLWYDGVERGYIARFFADRNSHVRVPLVLVLHGGGGNASIAERMTGFTEKSRTEGFVVVYPEGSGRFKNKLLTWNAGHCCGYAMDNRVDDVGFIDALIDELIETYPIDPARIYVTGMSNGAMMSHSLALALPGRFAAIAPVVGTLFGDEIDPGSPVSALMINGLRDESVPFEGGPPGGRFSHAWDGTPAKPAMLQAVFWAAVDDCSVAPARHERSTFTQWQYSCPAGRAVELYMVHDNGHAWPGGQKGNRGGDEPSSSFDATDVIWRFFKDH